MAGRLSRFASGKRYRSKNKERLTIITRINYYKRKLKESEKKLKELEETEAKKE